VKTVWFDELPPYPVRSFTYCNEQVGAMGVQRAIVYRYDLHNNYFHTKIRKKGSKFEMWETRTHARTHIKNIEFRKLIQGGAKRTRFLNICSRRWTVTMEYLFLKTVDGKNAMLSVPLLHGYWTAPSALLSGRVGRSPTTTDLKNMRSFCAVYPVVFPQY
jgi:hypothetical protein